MPYTSPWVHLLTLPLTECFSCALWDLWNLSLFPLEHFVVRWVARLVVVSVPSPWIFSFVSCWEAWETHMVFMLIPWFGLMGTRVTSVLTQVFLTVETSMRLRQFVTPGTLNTRPVARVLLKSFKAPGIPLESGGNLLPFLLCQPIKV